MVNDMTPASTQAAGFCPNARLVLRSTDHSTLHCDVVAIKSIGPGAMILALPSGPATDTAFVQLVGQFNGNCHRTDMVGGAGYVIYAVKGGESRVISCRSVALPSCSDNVEAEILACLFLVEELL